MSKTLMIQGTSSSVGKSLLVSALCRSYARRGIRVAPFKAQNMALNSYVTPDGLEIGRAQASQAFASRLDADVRMNPVLLKPEGDSISQIVVNGRPWKRARAGEYWRERETLWPVVTASLDSLRAEFELVVVEGAGSPAEINLRSGDIVNMAVALYANAPVLLVGDIDRGGVFASFVGTLALVENAERELVKGFIVNKFRGDLGLLEPGLRMLEERSGGVPVLGVLPWISDIALAEEDSVALSGTGPYRPPRAGDVDIAVIGFPHLSNFDDLDSLAMERGVSLRFVRSARELSRPDAIVLPGSKTTLADLRWLKAVGLADAIQELAASGTAVVGICGGYQMLGHHVGDPHGAEGGGEDDGLDLLDARTIFAPEKRTIRTMGRVIHGPFCFQNEASVSGYEVRMGRTTLGPKSSPIFGLRGGELDGARDASGRVWGTYLHGVFDLPDFRRAWLRSLGVVDDGTKGEALSARRDREYDRLADVLEASLDMRAVDALVDLD